MNLLFYYSFRNLGTRRLTTFMTAAGMALVIFVFAAILMLAEGLQKTLVETGQAQITVNGKDPEIFKVSGTGKYSLGLDKENVDLETLEISNEGKYFQAKKMIVLNNLSLPLVLKFDFGWVCEMKSVKTGK